MTLSPPLTDLSERLGLGVMGLLGTRPLARQTWKNLFFLHWPVPVSAVRLHVPDPLDIETFDGTAWVSLVLMQMSDGRIFGALPVPGLEDLSELNLRTYVRQAAGGSPAGQANTSGVWFFSLDATSEAAVWVARNLMHLPFFQAKGGVSQQDGVAGYQEFSCRFERISGPAARFAGRFAPVGDVFNSTPGSLDTFLTERMTMYMLDGSGRLQLGVVDHEPWPLQRAQGRIEVNTMAAAAGLTLPEQPPLLHYSAGVPVVAHPLRLV